MLHYNNSDILGHASTKLTLYNTDLTKKITSQLELRVGDMALLPSQEIIATDWDIKRFLKMSRDITEQFGTGTLKPRGICVNNSQQTVVGLEAGFRLPPIKLAIYSFDGSTLHGEIEYDDNGKQLFMKGINQVKQNRSGHYVVADIDRVVCVSKERRIMWAYKVEEFKDELAPIQSIAIDQCDNTIIAECTNNQITLLDSDGHLARTLLTLEDGIARPWSLSIDNKGLLYIGQECKRLIIVKYLK